MRLVLDTNVVVSALLWQGTPYRLLEAVRGRQGVHLYSSAVLLEELAEVLTRPMATKRLALIGLTPRQILSDYLDVTELVSPDTTPAVIAADADDDHVLAAAVSAGAELIVSGDHHLLTLVRHQGIAILRPADALLWIEQRTR